jgi:hypothetical protein
MGLKSRLDRPAQALGTGGLWDGTRLEDFRDALAAKHRGLPYEPWPGMVRAGECLRLVSIAIDPTPEALASIGLPADADRDALAARLIERGAAAGFTAAELAKLRSDLAKRLGRNDPCAV